MVLVLMCFTWFKTSLDEWIKFRSLFLNDFELLYWFLVNSERRGVCFENMVISYVKDWGNARTYCEHNLILRLVLCFYRKKDVYRSRISVSDRHCQSTCQFWGEACFLRTFLRVSSSLNWSSQFYLSFYQNKYLINEQILHTYYLHRR